MHVFFWDFTSTVMAVSGWLWSDAAEESRKFSLRYREGTCSFGKLCRRADIRNMLTLLSMENQGNANGPFIKYLKVHLGSHSDLIRVQEANWCCWICNSEFVCPACSSEGGTSSTDRCHQEGRSHVPVPPTAPGPSPGDAGHDTNWKTCY